MLYIKSKYKKLYSLISVTYNYAYGLSNLLEKEALN